MEKRMKGIKLTNAIINIAIIGSLIVALTSGYKLL
ncbi:hypothetical protein J2S74_000511 [Evansella vedderi]|uniref:Uncharacterized protein n=1 Tax=Evansella vedderi TaxID=38282 RepID=A0ABT9ZPH6_9BACI|nr:hypothetical protein [Evansella vedderi]